MSKVKLFSIRKMPRRPWKPKPPEPRYAVLVDDTGIPLVRNRTYRILYDDAAERDGLLCVSDELGEGYDHYEAKRFLFVRHGRPAKSNRTKANRILADALESEAKLLERGLVEQIGRQAPTLKRLLAVAPDWSQAVSYALGFWDELDAAARSGWRTYGGVGREEWIRFTRRVASEVRRGREALDLPILQYVGDPDTNEKQPSRPSWFRGVYGRNPSL